MRTRFAATATTAAIAALAVPAFASAATTSVYMGTPPANAKAFQKAGVDANAFFPSQTTVHVGDKVKFLPVGFHTVDLPKKGGKPLDLVGFGAPISGASDAAGQPYWFNAQGQPGFNPALFQSGFGKSFSYTGAKGVSSGLPLQNKPKAMTVKFTKAGSFTYFCTIHRGMKGTVRVVGKSASVPSAAAVKKAVKKQAAADAKVAKTLPKVSVPANTVDVGVAGKGGVEMFAFLPNALTVPSGTTVKFQMSPGTYDVHSATAGPGDPEAQPTSFLGKLANSINGPKWDPAAVYPSEKAGTTASLSPELHGNGFWNSGIMDNAPSTSLPSSNSVRFDKPGTYTFFCMIHPFMKGTVTVK